MRNDKTMRLSEMPRNADEPSAFQPPPGFEIGGDAVAPHHRSPVLPIATRGQGEPSEFQPPSGQILGDDVPMGNSLQGMTDNVLGDATRADLDDGCVALPPNASVESPNPSLVDADATRLVGGCLGRSNGWER